MTREDIYKGMESLHAKGKVMRKLGPDGRPLTRAGEQVYVADSDATPEELEYWRLEHAN